LLTLLKGNICDTCQRRYVRRLSVRHPLSVSSLSWLYLEN